MVTATKPHRSPSKRAAKDIVQAVRPVAHALAERSDLVMWDVTFTKVAGRDTLRVSLDRLDGVDADELARFSESLSRSLDRADVVPGDAAYVLEVSSPGAERKLGTPEHFATCVGRVAKITLTDGRIVEGTLSSATENAVEVDGSTRVSFGDIAKARLVVNL